MTRIQKIREDIFQLQCLDRETSIVSVDDLEWTVRQLHIAQAIVGELSGMVQAGTATDAGPHDGAGSEADARASLLLRAESFLRDLNTELSVTAPTT